MATQYGRFDKEPGTYVLTKIPEAGEFSYIYKNPLVFLKVDQHGPVTIQLDPPAGMFALQRKERETFSSWKYFFKAGNKLVHNFDLYNAKKFEIRYSPSKATYSLDFGPIKAISTIYVGLDSAEAYMDVELISKNGEDIKVLSVSSFDPIDTSMAVWDAKDWYMTTEVEGGDIPLFITRHFSVNGNKDERRNIYFLNDKKALDVQNSHERLRYFTRNLSLLPTKISDKKIEKVACYTQVCSSLMEIKSGETIRSIVKVVKDDETISKASLLSKLCEKEEEKILTSNKKNYESLIQRRTIKTKDGDFNDFVNYFLPLELQWVSDLDRGWPTGMRGSRDCANDFLGYLSYDLAKCKSVIKTLFDNLRYEDGWFPRQIPFGDSKKYDLRPFADSGAFVIELVYEYLCYSNDFSLLDEEFAYYASDKKGSGLEHLIKAACYYTLDDNIGEHGLIKLHGGDWLDCLNRVGLQGRGETLHVTCQALLAFKQVGEVLSRYGDEYQDVLSLFDKKAKEYILAIKKNTYLKDEGFYRGIFADDGNWYFSNKDLDGNKRVYVPSNAYTIISEVDPSKDKKVIKTIVKNNECHYGFKLFNTPFGNPPFEGIGKMGSGDFQPYMFENGSVYNHGANLFLVRALAKAKDHKTLYRAINYAMPYNPKFHPESVSNLPAYACTNVYNLIPSFEGRSGLCFLTGSIAMIHRSVYSWMFGLDYHVDRLEIRPCLPKQYGDSEITDTYNGHKLTILYKGYGANVVSSKVDGEDAPMSNGYFAIAKDKINKDLTIELTLN